MHIINKPVLQLTATEYRYCYRANLDSQGKIGRMRPDLVDARSWYGGDERAILLWDDTRTGASRLIGWALVQGKGKNIESFFWVKVPHRNKGYGTILMKEVKKISKVPRVYPWSYESGAFFSKFKVKRAGYTPETYLVKKPKVC